MGWAVWITGLPGSGKSRIARALRRRLRSRGMDAEILELDVIRRVITPNPTYSDEERDIVYSSLAYMAFLLTKAGKNAIIDATAHKRKYRVLARKLIPRFAEVYVKCPLDVCMRRERERKRCHSPKGIYERAGKGGRVPGVDVEYEEPENPEVIIESDRMSIDESVETILEGIKWIRKR